MLQQTTGIVVIGVELELTHVLSLSNTQRAMTVIELAPYVGAVVLQEPPLFVEYSICDPAPQAVVTLILPEATGEQVLFVTDNTGADGGTHAAQTTGCANKKS